jgi:hypothetical protein
LCSKSILRQLEGVLIIKKDSSHESGNRVWISFKFNKMSAITVK